jgi:D-serine deaminase-like pyridoxal phosphate-dependent protein
MTDRPTFTRRRVVVGAAALAGVGAAAVLRPADHGAPHDAYFRALGAALDAAGIAQPTLVVDRARFAHNLQAIRTRVPSRLPLRVVVKSLPSLALVDATARAWSTERLMLFNGAQLLQVAAARPQAQVLLGKPLPVAAAKAVLEAAPANGFDPARQVEWLVDTPARVAQYRALARGRAQPMRLAIEIDVGLHRGGIDRAEDLAAMLALIREEPLLQWAGFMGYDAHVAGIPDLPGLREKARAEMHARYDAMVATAAQVLGHPVDRATTTLNSGGSHTLHEHDGTRSPNEISVGSATVLPSDFDTPEQAELQRASFIATPVLKVMGGFRLPYGVEWIGRSAAWWNPNQRLAFAVHGGNWLADPVSPAGVAPSGLFGPSSNQQVMTAPVSAGVAPDGWVFWRPRQSESVFLQFGDIAVLDGDRIDARWPVFPASA